MAADTNSADTNSADTTRADADAAPTARTATGRPSGNARAVRIYVESRWVWYRRNWRATAVSAFVLPVLFLLSMGFGLGSQIAPDQLPGGLTYPQFLAPALLVVMGLQAVVNESTYQVIDVFKWSKRHHAVVASPITPAQVFLGTMLWNALLVLMAGAFFLVSATLFGALTTPAAALAVPVSVLTSTAYSAPITAFSATRDKADSFSTVFRLIVMPMTLFTGAFFPVEQLPDWLLPLVWIAPTWHGVELARGAAFGGLGALAALGHVAFLVAVLAVGTLIGTRVYRRRLVP